MRPVEQRKAAMEAGRLLVDLLDEIDELKERVRELEGARTQPSPRQSQRIWFNTAQAAEYTSHHSATVVKAAEAGELHGTQRKAGGRWRFHVACVDAWVLGDECVHKEPPPSR